MGVGLRVTESSGKWDGTTLPRREIGSFNGLVPSWLKTEEVPRMGLKSHDRWRSAGLW